MKALSLIFFYLAITILCFQELSLAAEFGAARPTDLQDKSQFHVNLNDSTLLSRGEILWSENRGLLWQECALRIGSHFNQSLAQQLGTVLYTMDSLHPQSYIRFDQGSIYEKFTLWLVTENKELPLLSLDCELEAPIVEKQNPYFTLDSITTLLGTRDFFYKPVLRTKPSKVAGDLLFRGIKLTSLVPLRFVGKTDGLSASMTNPHFQNGKLLTSSGVIKGSYCSASYQSSATELGDYDIMMPSGTVFKAITFTETLGVYQLFLESTPSGVRLEIFCVSSSGHSFSNFTEILVHLNSFFLSE